MCSIFRKRRVKTLLTTITLFVYIHLYNVYKSVNKFDSELCVYPKTFYKKEINRKGKTFQVDDETLFDLGIHPRCKTASDVIRDVNEVGYINENTLEKMEDSWREEVVFVTAASDDHYTESLDMIGSIQKYFPKRPIYYYDLGLTEGQRATIETWCGVILKDVRFDLYPPHTRDLMTYAFKPLLIQEVLRHHHVVFWEDASVRMRYNCTASLFRSAASSLGLVQSLPIDMKISVFSVTQRKMYNYFLPDVERLKEVDMIQAGALLVFKTRRVYEGVVYWWVLCALDPGCISPTDKLVCTWRLKNLTSEARHRRWLGCHRYDQSALNIITRAVYGEERPYHHGNQCFSVVRKPSTLYQASDLTC